MKSYLTNYLLSCFLLCSVLLISCQQPQTDPAAEEPETKPYGMSENAEAHLKLANDFSTALMAADSTTLRSLVNESFIQYGPAAGDSMTIDQLITAWSTVSASRSDQKAGIFAANALTVNEGDFKGEWVNLWGTYTAHDDVADVDYTVPWHRVMLLKDGKISFTNVWFDALAPNLAAGNVTMVETE